MQGYAVFFRGVNVGGHRKLPMAALREALVKAGFPACKSYIQSGNLALLSPWSKAETLERIDQVIARDFGFSAQALALTEPEVALALTENPFAESPLPPNRIHVAFHMEGWSPFDPAGQPVGDDKARIISGGIADYLETPDGLSSSKLAEIYSRRMKDSVTARNLRTVEKVHEMLAGLG